MLNSTNRIISNSNSPTYKKTNNNSNNNSNNSNRVSGCSSTRRLADRIHSNLPSIMDDHGSEVQMESKQSMMTDVEKSELKKKSTFPIPSSTSNLVGLDDFLWSNSTFPLKPNFASSPRIECEDPIRLVDKEQQQQSCRQNDIKHVGCFFL